MGNQNEVRELVESFDHCAVGAFRSRSFKLSNLDRGARRLFFLASRWRPATSLLNTQHGTPSVFYAANSLHSAVVGLLACLSDMVVQSWPATVFINPGFFERSLL